MDEVRAADALEVREPTQPAKRKPPVDEPVVDEEVGEAERGRADADPEPDVEHSMAVDQHSKAAEKTQQRSGRRVRRRQQIVRIQRAVAGPVVRLVPRPQRAVPQPLVDERRPQLEAQRSCQREQEHDHAQRSR